MKENVKLTLLIATLRSLHKSAQARNFATIETERVNLRIDEVFFALSRITGLHDEDVEITRNFDQNRRELRHNWKEAQLRYITKEDYLRVLDDLISNAIEHAARNGWCVDGEPDPEPVSTPAADETPGGKKTPPTSSSINIKKAKILRELNNIKAGINRLIEIFENEKITQTGEASSAQ